METIWQDLRYGVQLLGEATGVYSHRGTHAGRGGRGEHGNLPCGQRYIAAAFLL